jgi:hypothetical protein
MQQIDARWPSNAVPGKSTSFGIFHVRLVFENTGWNARCALTTLRNGAI